MPLEGTFTINTRYLSRTSNDRQIKYRLPEKVNNAKQIVLKSLSFSNTVGSFNNSNVSITVYDPSEANVQSYSLGTQGTIIDMTNKKTFEINDAVPAVINTVELEYIPTLNRFQLSSTTSMNFNFYMDDYRLSSLLGFKKQAIYSGQSTYIANYFPSEQFDHVNILANIVRPHVYNEFTKDLTRSLCKINIGHLPFRVKQHIDYKILEDNPPIPIQNPRIEYITLTMADEFGNTHPFLSDFVLEFEVYS